MSQAEKLINRVEVALANANAEQTKLTDQQLVNLKGLSSKKIRILLNELIKEDTNYLEVGTFTGSTFVNAMYGNKPMSATVIDSFSAEDSWEMDMKVDVTYHGNKIKNGLFLLFLENCRRNNIQDFTCVQGDCFNLLFPDKYEIRNVDTYLFDAGHSKEDHTKAITYYLNNLADVFIYIVDDWNDPIVREGTRLGFESSFVKIHKEWEIFSEVKMIGKERHYDKDWWNGYYIAVCEKPFGFFLPEEEPSKELWCSITETIGE
jgi:hypothetical protein